MRSKKDCRMFFLLLMFLNAWIIFGENRSVFATVFISTTWDTGTPAACWPWKSSPCTATFDGWTSPGDDGWGFFSSTRSSVMSHSGDYSYYQFRASGSPATADIYYTFNQPYPTTIHIRFYLYLTTSFNSFAKGNTIHWIFTNSHAAGVGFRLNFISQDEYSCGNLGPNAMMFCPEGDSNRLWDWHSSWNVCRKDYKDYIGAWHCFEYRMVINQSPPYNVTLTEWIDGVQTQGPITGPGQNGPYFTRVILSGWENTSAAWNQGFYIDDIVIADSYIGPSAVQRPAPPPDNSSPSAPTGLKIIGQ